MKPIRRSRSGRHPLRAASPLGDIALGALAALPSVMVPATAGAFCGFYVSQGDAKLFNRVSKVVLARDGDRTVITMMSDYQGDPSQFAVVVPVPIVPVKEQVHIGDPAWVDHLEQYSVPRLVEYHDPNPCPPEIRAEELRSGSLKFMTRGSRAAKVVGDVSIEAQYKVDEYEIVILSAKEGHGLETWLTTNGYRVPTGAASVLNSYIRQGMYFFVAKVDVAEMRRRGSPFLRPIQVAYESPKFVLPIRLGMSNAEGAQEMYVFTLTRKGRVEATNYRTVQVPTDLDVPEFVKGEFAEFYRFVFAKAHRDEGEEAIFLEYAWNVEPSRPTCDPCTAPFLTPEELRALGAYWVTAKSPRPPSTYLTRLHLRYDRRHFPEDLQLHETGNRVNWQVRYVIRHPYRGPEECPQLAEYRGKVWARRREEAKNYCELVGADLAATRRKMGVLEDWSEPDEALEWWKRLWR